MGRIIAIANQKGGVGKTTTSVNLSACLAHIGKKVLLIDTDPQGNATSGVGINKGDVQYCIYDVLIDDVDIKDVILQTSVENLDVIPATISLAGAEIELVSTISREVRMKHAIQDSKDQYDYVIIDCPPSLGLLTINALTASDAILIPVQCEYYALEGLSQLLSTIRLVQKHLNEDLQIDGVLLTMFDARTNLGIQVIEEVKKYFQDKVYKTIIPRNVRLSEAPSHGKPIIVYDSKSRGAEVYLELQRKWCTMGKGLGKGVNALFPGESLSKAESVEHIHVKSIKPNPYQPRKIFDENAIEELSYSIKEHGILQPIIVRKTGMTYEIVVGERRYRAAKLAGLKEVPAVVRVLTDEETMEFAILENLQREDLTPIEEAEAYQNLMEKLKLTQEQLSFRLGKSRSHIANHVRLLSLPEKVRNTITEGKLSMGHGRTLLGLRNKEQIIAVADRVLRESLNVRQLEKLVQRINEDVPRETKPKAKEDLFLIERESTLREYFGTNVTIKKTKNKGKIEIDFFSEEDLERILELLED